MVYVLDVMGLSSVNVSLIGQYFISSNAYLQVYVYWKKRCNLSLIKDCRTFHL